MGSIKIDLLRIIRLSNVREEDLISQVYDYLSEMRPEAQVVFGFPDEKGGRVLFIFAENGLVFMGTFSVPQKKGDSPVVTVEDNALPFTSAEDFLDRIEEVRRGAGASEGEVFVDRNGAKARLDEFVIRDLLEKAGVPV